MRHARRRSLRHDLLTTAIGLAVVGTAMVTAPPIAATPISVRYPLNRRLNLVTTRIPNAPLEIRKLVVTPGASAVPDIATASARYPMYALTSRMSARTPAIAGVNGDFGTPLGQPKHVLMIDGELWTTGQSRGNAIGWSDNGRGIYIGRPDLRIQAKVGTTSTFSITDWNANSPTASSVSAYTSRGGAVTVPPGHVNPTVSDPTWCEALLTPLNDARWNGTSHTAIVRRYTVTIQRQPCPQTPLSVGSTRGAIVLASQYSSSIANAIMALSVGDAVKIAWRFADWPDVTDVMGGGAVLVDKGANVAPHWYDGADHILNFNPRTALGITKGCSDTNKTTSCKFLLMTIDGRQSSTNWSEGVRLPATADALIRSKAWMGLNLDGGGSTTMWLKPTDPAYCESSPSVGGCLVQRPSQATGERATRTAIVVLPSADTGTPLGLR